MKRMKMKILGVFSVVCTLLAATMATSVCFWFLYQPEEPESLKEV